MKCGLLPMSQTSIRFVGHIGYHDYEGPAIDLDERERLVRDLGPHDAMIMRNHGLLTCGATIQQAFNTMYQLELSCRSQVDAMAAQTELTMPGENVLAHTAHLYQPGARRPYGVLGMAGDAAASRGRTSKVRAIRRTGTDCAAAKPLGLAPIGLRADVARSCCLARMPSTRVMTIAASTSCMQAWRAGSRSAAADSRASRAGRRRSTAPSRR